MGQAGAALGPRITLVRAPNAGPMTLDGTNTWILRDADVAVVVDPGPDIPSHLAGLLELTGHRRTHVLVTHSHADHVDLVPRLRAETGASVLRLADGQTFTAGRLSVTAVTSPGHTADSVCFWVAEPGEPPSLLSGDTVLGRGTALVAGPDGCLADYLSTLDRLREQVAARPRARILPGHGPVRSDAASTLDRYIAHRRERLEQVRQARAAGARTTREIVTAVYTGLDPQLRDAAERGVAAQVAYLDGERVNAPGAPDAPDRGPAPPAPPTGSNCGRRSPPGPC